MDWIFISMFIFGAVFSRKSDDGSAIPVFTDTTGRPKPGGNDSGITRADDQKRNRNSNGGRRKTGFI